jgi:hypothetical protein
MGVEWLILAAVLTAQEPERQLLSQISEAYESLGSYELKGQQSTTLPGTGCEASFPFAVWRESEATSRGQGAESSLPPTILFPAPKASQRCLDEVGKRGGVNLPGSWADFSSIATGVAEVKTLRSEV